MFLALVCLQAQAAGLLTQPISIDVVGYQRVEHALSNGLPDPAAKDNFYVRVTSHFTLIVDSDKTEPDADGVRRIHVPKREFDSNEWYEETRPAPADLAAAFKEVFPPATRDGFKKHKVGWGSSGGAEQTVTKGYRFLVFQRVTLIEKVETHTKGKLRVTRTEKSDTVGFHSAMAAAGKVLDPSKEKVYWCDSKPEVRVDPPVYKYK
jgi:hypothetical protein